MANVTLTAPAGMVGSVIGSDGNSYPIASGSVSIPANAIGPGMFASGFSFGAGGTGGTGVTGLTGVSELPVSFVT